MSTVSTSTTTTERRAYSQHRQKRGGNVVVLLLRAIRFNQLDFEYAMATVAELVWSPSRVYKLVESRYEIKGHRYRDDPAFLLILCGFVVADFLAYGFALDESWSFTRTARHIFVGLGSFFSLGLLVATGTWFVTNKYFQVRHPHSSYQRVEWLYAFDVHCNAFLPAFIILGVLQYLLLPFLIRNGILFTLLSNTMHLGAALAYVHYTGLGFYRLPFLNPEKVTSLWIPAFFVVVLWFLLSLFNVNCTRLFFYRVF